MQKNDRNILYRKKRVILSPNQIKKSQQIIVIDRFNDRLRETSRKLYRKKIQKKKKQFKIGLETQDES